MPPKTGQDIYGFYESRPPPEHFFVTENIDKTPVDLPNVLSEDKLPPFKHPCIDPNTQIRLISLLPPERPAGCGDSREPLQCTIEVHSLAKALEYEALSYTWGGIHRHMPISVIREDADKNCVEEALFATPQLLMALRRLRLASNPRRLWIDQLCIDQENSKEVGSQVQLMGDIYKAARRVVVWLGEDITHTICDSSKMWDEADSTHLLDLIREIPSHNQNTTDNTSRVTSLVRFGLTWHFEHLEMRRLRAVYELLWRPWFRRAWVFQEASLAKQLSVQFGRAEMDFGDLENVCSAIHRAEIDLGIHRDILGLGDLATSTAGFEMMRLIQQTRRAALHQNIEIETSSPGDQHFLCKLLQVLRRVKCYNPRDLIFAFLAFQNGEGIVSTGDAYQSLVEDVWRTAAEKIIQSSSSLDIFATLSGDTWVPRWDNCFPFGRPIATPVSRFQACRGMPHKWERNQDTKRLRVKGKIIDVIQKRLGYLVRAPMHYSALDFSLSWSFYLESAKGYLYTDEILEKLGDYVSIKTANMERDVMRTLLADGALGSEQPLKRIDKFVDVITKSTEIREMRHHRSSLTENEKLMVADYERMEALALVAEGKGLFFTEYINIGLVADAAQEGDFVAILHGSKAPIVLRKVNDKKNEFKAICQCYLNGWMYGRSPKEVFGKDSSKHPHPHGSWWEERPDEIVLV
jgi:hypothetical protein